jgi:hypothetical protein
MTTAPDIMHVGVTCVDEGETLQGAVRTMRG